MTEEEGNIKQEFNFAQTGLNLDLTPSQVKEGMTTFCLNGSVENFDANGISYQNEQGNEFCISFPEGFVLIGKHFINEQSRHIFFITNPNEPAYPDQIGYMDNNDGLYHIMIQGAFGFNIHYPIHKCVHKINNCSTEIYWTDGLNSRRYLNFDKIPYVLIGGTPACNPIYGTDIDVNQLKLQPNFNIPELSVSDVTNVGTLVEGTYQFAIQYCDISGNEYTSYYSVTNPTPITDTSIVSVNFNNQIGKSIVLDITNLDLSGQFQYFNLAVIKTINAISSVELVGTYFIEGDSKQIIYTGQSSSNTTTNIRLSINDIFEKFPYYDIANDLTAVQDVLVWDDLISIDRINYQGIANGITLQWQTWRIPADENYSNELNATNYRSYLRDEVYPFEIVFLLKNGKQTDGFHIPGRAKDFNELHQPDVPNTDADFIGTPDYYDSEIGYSPFWKIYNTASVVENDPEYTTDPEYKGPYQTGEFAYWESTEQYPCNKDVWGELAGQNIRHHKFPDILVSPIFESQIFTGMSGMVMSNEAIFPIGIKIDVDQIKTLINISSLTTEQKGDIVGFKIVRGDRSTNKSVIAKGILRNVGIYTRENDIGENNSFYFPNYPYNDLNEDVFINRTNNAYTDECASYDITIDNIPPTSPINPPDPITGKPYAEVSYVDCSTNNNTTIKYFTIGSTDPITGNPYRICSIGRPSFDQGTGTVCTSSYEVWNVHSGGWLSRGYRYGWYDRCKGWSEDWMPGNEWGGTAVSVQVVPNTGGVTQVEGPGSIHTSYVETITPEGISCSEAQGLPPIRSNPSLAYRQIFNSPETSFSKPFLGNILKLENVIFGAGIAHFAEVKNNAKYRLITEEAQHDALTASEIMAAMASPFDPQVMFSAYQTYLQIYLNGITRKNFAYSYNSIANYDYWADIPNGQGVKQRNLDIKTYLVPNVVSTTDDNPLNNWERETSIYLRTVGALDDSVPPLPFPDQSPDIPIANPPLIEKSRVTASGCDDCNYPNRNVPITVVSYYASIKDDFVNQWGQIYSYTTIDTGYQNTLTNIAYNTIFGGDTFINRFAFKIKLPFFLDNRVNAPDDSDIFYDEIGNVGFPVYWHSARSILKDYVIQKVGRNAAKDAEPLTNIISYKAHNFDCPNSQGETYDSSGNVISTDTTAPGRTYYSGYYYLFAYGIPNFYCESSVNVDLRQAFNSKEGDFFPHVTNHIPDDWVQESKVSIANDNTYYYNTTFSKQNKENVFTHLPPDWESDLCYTLYPFRAIYSDSQNTDADNRVNAWLNYRALSYFDFPQNYGNLISLDGIQNRAILARFEDKTLMYDNLLTIDTSNPQAAYVGNPNMFRKSPPIDFAETDLGYLGSQNTMLLKIPQGQLTVDAKRGQVFLLNGSSNAVDLSGFGSGLNRFFTDHLAFEILRWFPDVDTDNNYNGIGLHGVYDSKFDRLILTKLDYIPIDKNVKYDSVTRDFYIENITSMHVCDCALFGIAYGIDPFTLEGEAWQGGSPPEVPMAPYTQQPCASHQFTQRVIVSLNDPNYFCNKSWTLSYNVNTKSWISFHSYIPNWYIGENNFFYSGINGCCGDFDFIAGTMVTTTSTTSTTSTTTTLHPPTTTTTSTSTSTTSTTTTATTSTTTTLYPPTTTTTTTICQRPMGLTNYPLVTGYTLTTPPVEFGSTGSEAEACSAEYFLSTYDISKDPNGLLVNILRAQAFSLSLWQKVYNGWVATDCNVVPDGWYFTEELMYSNLVFNVISGIIVEIDSCISSTTTTSSTTSTTTTLYLNNCGDIILYNSGLMYEKDYSISVGSVTGTTLFDFNTDVDPVRFIVIWNSSNVIDTGYHGDVDYDFGGANRSMFNFGLLGKIDPVTHNAYPDAITYTDDGYPRISSATVATYSFSKSTASPTNVEVSIYSSIDDSTGKFRLYCPGVTTTTTITLTPTTTTTTTHIATTTTTTTH
jgi:hypothetical protein